ncbi:aminotransferase class I/II-fold pyridoxal phosphate-dependent enzyme [Parasedimentitalea huanghaiensis]|uniref:Aminotransferase class I/II-fold pyridoxal phosphate-dependent enzyme n=1 Tax=Parasedimentitalea huanghaiensis TaxID=2682100 RepID=A0A6L6WDD7_9RHOB|nr:aminotransferase class I/II-fold pyridoxal phosphate-dependent enzyme [Zongyanglinia huanghaiensis]MVO14605.1 aminotransferase class I/II-fold pyridoxal phosphate-dependent enzyme [Zongyanglinia huanghaiensis]
MTGTNYPNLSLATILAEAHTESGGSVTPPIVQSSLFTFDSYESFEHRMAGHGSDPIYTRVQNPTVAAFEGLMAKSEKGEAAVGFASGMAAISSTLMTFLKPGDRVACIEHVYPDTYRLFERLLRPFGVEVSYHSPAAFENDPNLLDGVRLAYLESPSSTVFEVTNLLKVAEHARRHGTLTVIDNSWASPILQNPLALGIDVTLHSASKYISGHSDTVAGVVVANQDLIDQIRELALPLLGAKLAPFEAFLLTRGLRTLDARIQQHQRTADLMVDRLSRLSCVTRIHSPSSNSVPGLKGRSGLMSVEFAPNIDIKRFSNALSLFRLGVSWGGFESLIMPAQVGLAQKGEKNSMQRFGVSPSLVRLNLGLEEPEDLWADITTALSHATL